MTRGKIPFSEHCAERAYAGESGFAIAYALLELADKLHEVAISLDKIGLNNMNPAGPPGALEMIGMQMKEVVQALADISANRSD